MVSESCVTWATSVPILVFLGLSVLDLGPMYVTDRQTDVRQHHRLMPLPRGRGHNNDNTHTHTIHFNGQYPDELTACTFYGSFTRQLKTIYFNNAFSMLLGP